MKKYIVLICIAVLAAVGCKPEPFINVDSTLDVKTAGGNFTINIEANYDWTASSNVSWISIPTASQTSASDPTKIVVNIVNNPTTDPRVGIITITSEEITKQITVTQAQLDKVEFVSGNTSVDYESHDVEIKLKSNVEYDVEIPDGTDWISYEKVKSMTESSFILKIDANTSITARNAIITCANKSKTARYEITVKQAGRPQSLSLLFRGNQLAAPEVSGLLMTDATIDWGDGTKQDYEYPLIHDYDAAGEYTVVVEATKATDLRVEGTDGISFIDLSGFYE